MRVLRMAVVIVGALVLLLAGSVAALLAVLNDENYRHIATYLAERATGRAVTIEGPFSFHVGLEPSLSASDIRVANPPWASQPDLARIGHLEVQLALRPLLSGALLIPRLVLEDADFELEKGADGKTNWVMPPAGGRGLVPVLGTVALRNVGWHYRDQATGRKTSIALGHLTLENVGNVARLDGDGMWDGQQIGAKGEFGTLAQALDPTKPFPIDLSVSLPALELTLHGTVADPVAGQGLDLRLTGRSDNIGELIGLLHSDLPLAGRLEGEAKLSGELAALRLPDLHLTVVRDQSRELELTGQIGAIRPQDAVILQGIDCKVQLATTTTVLSSWLKREVPDLGRVGGRFAVTGSSRALRLANLDLQVGSADRLMIGAQGAVGEIRLKPELTVRGVDLRVEAKAPTTAPLAKMLDRPLPELGPVDGRFALTGSSEALKLADVDLKVGDDRLTIAAIGTVDEVRLKPDPSVHGINVRIQGKAPATTPLAELMDRRLPELGPVDGRVTLSGSSDALKLADLDLKVGGTDRPTIAATGAVDEIRLKPDLSAQGINVRVEAKSSSTAPLAKVLDRPLPELGPVDGRFALTGSLEALKLADLDLRVGSVNRLTVAATGTIDDVRLQPEPTVRGVDVRVEASAPGSAALANVLGARPPELGVLRASGRLTGGLDRLDLDGVDLRAGPPERPVRVTGRIDNVFFLGAGGARATFASDFAALLGWALDRELPALGPLRGRAELADIGGHLRIERLEATAGDTEVLSASVAGTPPDARSSTRSGLEIEVAAKDLAILGTMLDASIPALGPFSFKGRLEGDLETPRLSGQMRLGQTQIDETLRASFAGARPWISGQLTTPVLYLADLGIRPDGPWQQNTAANGAPPGAPATSLAPLRTLDLSLSVRIDQLEGTRLSIDRAGLNITLQDGVVYVNSNSFDLLEGSAELDATVDTSVAPPKISLDASADDLQLGKLLAQFDADVPIEGELDLKTALQTAGTSLPGLTAALNGEFGMAIERGRIHLRYFDLTGANLLQWLFAGAALRSSTDLRCFVARFGIENGVATAQSLFMDTSLARSTGSGTLNLVDRTIDILVHPRPARAELVRLTTPYRIVGPLSDPSVEINRVGLAGRAVGEIALTPFRLLGSLTSLVSDWGKDPANPCLTWTQSGPADGGRRRRRASGSGFMRRTGRAQPGCRAGMSWT
jgi:uncharacterized protein involved in outer membrane biogenesis